jgi:hypothetical protein
MTAAEARALGLGCFRGILFAALPISAVMWAGGVWAAFKGVF